MWVTKKNSCDTVPFGGSLAPNPRAGNNLSLQWRKHRQIELKLKSWSQWISRSILFLCKERNLKTMSRKELNVLWNHDLLSQQWLTRGINRVIGRAPVVVADDFADCSQCPRIEIRLILVEIMQGLRWTRITIGSREIDRECAVYLGSTNARHVQLIICNFLFYHKWDEQTEINEMIRDKVKEKYYGMELIWRTYESWATLWRLTLENLWE